MKLALYALFVTIVFRLPTSVPQCQADEGDEEVAKFEDIKASLVGEEAAEDHDEVAERLFTYVEADLNRAKLAANLTDAELLKTKQLLKSELEKGVKNRTLRRTYSHESFAKLRRILAAQLHKVAGKTRAAKFEADTKLIAKIRKSCTVEMLLMVFDRTLGLTQKQFDSLERSLGQNWDPDWADDLDDLAVHPHSVAAQVPTRILKPVLTAEQVQTWELVNADADNEEGEVGSGPEEEGAEESRNYDQETRLQKRLVNAMLRRVDLIDHETNLTDKQRLRLRVAAKGVAEQLIERRFGNSEPTGGVNYEGMEFDRAGPGTLVVAHSKWHAYVRKSLRADQYQVYQRLMDRRGKRLHDAFTLLFTFEISTNVLDTTCTGEQQQKLAAYFMKRIKRHPRQVRLTNDFFMQMFAAPKKDLVAILGDESGNELAREFHDAQGQMADQLRGEEAREVR